MSVEQLADMHVQFSLVVNISTYLFDVLKITNMATVLIFKITSTSRYNKLMSLLAEMNYCRILGA
jgi:hypothetical protein